MTSIKEVVLILFTFIAITAFFVLSVVVTANAGNQYEALDTNKDGNLSRREAAADPNITRKWERADINKDNKIDEGEFARFAVINDLETRRREQKP